VLVHCGQHYRSRHSKLTCAGAPIFDALGRLAGVLDVSAVASEGSDRPQQLALAATVASAREVEERLFREHFRHAWVIAAMPKDETHRDCWSLWTKTNALSVQIGRHGRSFIWTTRV